MSAQLKTVSELYDTEIPSEDINAQHSKIKIIVKRSVDQKLRLQKFHARHGRIKSGAVVKNRKGSKRVGGKGTCYQWEEKGQCSQGDRCSFRHETQDCAQKRQHTAATPSEPTVSRGRGREVSEAKATMVPFFDNRADIV